MSRREFSKEVRREALKRSGQLCEASGPMYGLKAGQRCNCTLSVGVQFDHIISDSSGGEPTLDNCAAVCLPCHGWKSRNVDTPKAAKIKRVSDKHRGIRKAPSFQKPKGIRFDWSQGRYVKESEA